MFWYLIVVVVCLFFSGLFSGSETALFSMSKTLLVQLKETKPKSGARVSRLLANPPRLLGTILLSNLFVNVIASSVWTLFILALVRYYRLSQPLYLAIGSIVMTALLLVFGEVLPKLWALRNPLAGANFLSPLITFFTKVFSPMVGILSLLGFKILRRTKSPDFPTDEELLTMIEIGREQGTITATEEEILHNLIELEKRTASEVMTPRIKICGLERNSSCDEALQFAKETGFSRFPVFDQTIDTIIGILYVKDLLIHSNAVSRIDAIMRQPYFIPEVKKLSSLLEELRKKGSHIAIVVDEFGQTAGLITLEDVLEAIFGEISDEYDLSSDLPYFQVDEKTYLVDGEIDLRTLNRIFKRAFKGLDYERLSGFICAQLNRLPTVGDSFTFRKLRFEVKAVNNNRIEKVLIQSVRGE
jgi:CBS domain containing-hemolysin-like protein